MILSNHTDYLIKTVAFSTTELNLTLCRRIVWECLAILWGCLLKGYHKGSKAKGRISKQVFQEKKAHQIFRKMNISYPLTRTRMCAYQGVRNIHFSENLASFVFWNTCFEIRPFSLLPSIHWFAEFRGQFRCSFHPST